MTDCNSLRRGISKLSELVPNPFDLFNKLCSKQLKLSFCHVMNFEFTGLL